MRTFELRVFKLRTKEALDFYREKIYPRHLNSFPLFGIEAHGFWTAREDVEPRLFVLASYAAGEDPGEGARRDMQSTEFADDCSVCKGPTCRFSGSGSFFGSAPGRKIRCCGPRRVRGALPSACGKDAILGIWRSAK